MADFHLKENLTPDILNKNQTKEDEQFKSRNRITKEYLKKLLRSDIKLYYTTAHLNDILYLHFKGFDSIENLEEFTELKVLYLEGNCISVIENLQNKDQLRALYLQENMINKIENVQYLDSLITLNLNDNFVQTIENLDRNQELENLQLKRNKIGVNGLADILHLTRIKKLASLDISNNFIDGNSEDFLKIIENCPKLAVLYLMGNPICAKIANYRKTLIARLKNLKYLDDRPVFVEDRIFAEAFYFEGVEAERKARENWKKEEEEKHWRNHQAFKDMLYNGIARQPEQEEQQESTQDSNVPIQTEKRHKKKIEEESVDLAVDLEVDLAVDSVPTSHLETYNSKTEENSKDLNKSSEFNFEKSVDSERGMSDKELSNSMSLTGSIKETHSLETDFEALD